MSKKENGFTVVELLITIAICGVIIPLLAAGLNSLVVVNNRSRDLSLVTMLAQNKIELLRSAGYNSLAVGTTDFSGELPSSLASPKSASYNVVSTKLGVKEVQLSITYNDYSTPKTVQFKTSITELGIGQ